MTPIVLTVKKLAVYDRFGGDIDGWARASSAEDKAALSDGDWHLIDALLQGLALAAGGLASAAFSQEIERKAAASTADEAAHAALMALAASLRKKA